jgi:hypothetical protein
MRPSGFYYPDTLIRLFAAVERYVWCRVKTGNDKRGLRNDESDPKSGVSGLLAVRSASRRGKLMQRCEFMTLLGGAGAVPTRLAAWRKSPPTGSHRR